MTDLLFPVATFDRVFDTDPTREVLPLPELVRALRRFEVKTSTALAVRREVTRIERLIDELRAGRDPGGPIAKELRSATDFEAAAAHQLDLARKSAKRDLRLWSPALYRDGARRGSDGVSHLSCLVLDYDAGVDLDDALLAWEGLFHIVHSTWSHRPDHPRFRVVLPLSGLVDAEDWAAVWTWAADRAGFPVDHALKGRGAAFALPALPDPEAPHFSLVHPGALFDPAAEGIPVRAVDIPLVAHGPPEGPSPMIGVWPKKRFVA